MATKNQNNTGKQKNNSTTSFGAKKVKNDKSVGGYGKAFTNQPENNSRPT